MTREASHKYVLNKHGVSVEEYNRRFVAQGGVCAICGKPETRATKRGLIYALVLDHDHETGAIRGLLCHKCNAGIGLLDDDPDTISKALEYLINA